MQTTSSESLADRLDYLKLDAPSLATLRSLKPLVEKHLPTSLDFFYSHIGGYPELRRFFRDSAHMQAAKGAQMRHWSRIADGRFDEGYASSARAIGNAHARLGVSPSRYIGGYALIIERLLATALPDLLSNATSDDIAAKANDIAAGVGVLIKAALLDMDLTTSTYLDSLEAALPDRRRIVA